MKKRSAFTLIEMLISIGILVVVLMMTSGLVTFSAGRIRSMRIKLLSDTIRLSFDQINQKMVNANDKTTGLGLSPKVYGFLVYLSPVLPNQTSVTPLATNASSSNSILMTVTSTDSCTGGPTTCAKVCTFLGYNATKKELRTSQNDCTSFLSIDQLYSSLTSKKIIINSYTIKNNYTMTNTTPSEIPSVTISVKAQDAQDASNTAELTSTFTMDLDNLNFLKY